LPHHLASVEQRQRGHRRVVVHVVFVGHVLAVPCKVRCVVCGVRRVRENGR
jgi:hypothetical protein